MPNNKKVSDKQSDNETTSYCSNQFVPDETSDDSAIENASSSKTFPKTVSTDFYQPMGRFMSRLSKSNSFLDSFICQQLKSSKILKVAAKLNPLEQTQLVVAFVLSGLYHSLQKQPDEVNFKTEQYNDGSYYIAHQKGNHITFTMNGPQDLYKLTYMTKYGPTSSQTINTLQLLICSQVTVSFGCRTYNCQLPNIRVVGDINSNRLLGYFGNLSVVCLSTKIHADIHMAYNSHSSISVVGGKLFTVFQYQQRILLNEFIDVSIYKKQILDNEEIITPLQNMEDKWLNEIAYGKQMASKMHQKILKSQIKNNPQIKYTRLPSLIYLEDLDTRTC